MQIWFLIHTLTHWDGFPDDIFKCICLNENVWISLNIILKFVPKVQLNNIPALVQIMAWRRPGDKPLSEPKMESLLMHICFTRPQWVKLLAGLADLCWWQNFYYSEVLSSCPNHGCIWNSYNKPGSWTLFTRLAAASTHWFSIVIVWLPRHKTNF